MLFRCVKARFSDSLVSFFIEISFFYCVILALSRLNGDFLVSSLTFSGSCSMFIMGNYYFPEETAKGK
jgi:hypothetical protein